MNQYENLDNLILQRLKEDGEMMLLFLNSGDVREESERIANETGREPFRILDGRLQKLRKENKIKFSRKGWVLTNGE